METNGEKDAVLAAEAAAARADRAEASLAKTRRLELCLVLVAALAGLSAMGFSGWNSFRTRQFGAVIKDCTTPGGKCFEQARKQNTEFREQLKQLIRDVGQCQTLQLLEHRDANERAHALNALKHGYMYSAPAVESPPPIPEELKKACDQFLTPAQGGTRP